MLKVDYATIKQQESENAAAQQQPSEMKTDDNTNLYIAKLPSTFHEGDLNGLFIRYGSITSSRILSDEFGQSKCSGFVRYSTREEAEKAISNLNGAVVDGCVEPLLVKWAATKGHSGHVNTPHQGQRQNVGPIRTNPVHVNRFNPMSQQPGQPGQMGQNNQPYMHNNMQQPSQIPPPTPELVQQSFTANQGWCVYISNLSEDVNELSLYKLFSPFGAISSVRPMMDPEKGSCRGFGFVNMPQYEAAYSAVRSMHGIEMAGKQLNVSFKCRRG